MGLPEMVCGKLIGKKSEGASTSCLLPPRRTSISSSVRSSESSVFDVAATVSHRANNSLQSALTS